MDPHWTNSSFTSVEFSVGDEGPRRRRAFEDGRRDLHDGQHNLEHEPQSTIASSDQANRFTDSQTTLPFALSEPQSAPPFPTHEEKIP
jgi:hypothetical protein